MIKMTVHDIPSSNNTTQGKGGVKRALSYNQEKKIWAGYFVSLKMKMRKELQEKSLPLQEATVITVYNFKDNRDRDPDNFSGKMIHDGLTAAGFIVKDTFKNIDIVPLATFENKISSVDIYIIEGKHLIKFAKKICEGREFVCGRI
jgi:crossover junction endodeoxyribonuclease RusA